MADKSDNGSKNWFVRHKILTVIGVILLLAIIGGAGSDKSKKSDTATTGNTSKSKSTEAAAYPKIGEVARDGKFEFTVTKVACGETTVGTNQYLQKTAQGQFCRLSLSIKNIGDKAQSLFSGDQKLAANGKEYSADDTATMYASPDSSGSTWYNNINPGNSVTGEIIFDIPVGVTPLIAILHDSSLSNGVTVSLQ